MFNSLSASKKFDSKDYTWYKYNKSNPFVLDSKKFGFVLNRYHPVVTIKHGEVFGLRKNVVGNYVLRLEDAVHIEYKIPKEHARFADIVRGRSKLFTGPLDLSGIEGSYVKHRRKIENVVTPDKQTATYYFKKRQINEKQFIDYDNYQWRKVRGKVDAQGIRGYIKIISKERKRFKYNLKPGDIFGMRFFDDSHGGYILNDKNQRVNVDTLLYTEIADNAIVLPENEQKQGIIDAKTGAKNELEGLPIDEDEKLPRERSVRQSQLDELDEEEDDALISRYDIEQGKYSMENTKKGGRQARLRSAFDKIFKVDDLDTLENMSFDDVGDFEDQEEKEKQDKKQGKDTRKAKPIADAEDDETLYEGDEDEMYIGDEDEIDIGDEEDFDPIDEESIDDIEGEYKPRDPLDNVEDEDLSEPETEDDFNDEPIIEYLKLGDIIEVVGTQIKYAIIDLEPVMSTGTGQELDITKIILHKIDNDEAKVFYRTMLKNDMTVKQFNEVFKIVEDKEFPIEQVEWLASQIEESEIKRLSLK